MAFEVEIKARVTDPEGVERLLDERCRFERAYVKKDIYLIGPTGRVEDAWAHWTPKTERQVRAEVVLAPPDTSGSADAGSPDGGAPWDSPSTSNVEPDRRSPARDFRVRIDGPDATCTFKDRSLSSGTEVNREIEFPLPDVRGFLELVCRLECRVYACKVKEGKRYVYAPRDSQNTLTVELSRLEGLGYFLEVERVVATNTDASDAEEAIRVFFRMVGIHEDRFEDTPYAKLMADGGVSHCDRIEELASVPDLCG